jgi:hypothetical protein
VSRQPSRWALTHDAALCAASWTSLDFDPYHSGAVGLFVNSSIARAGPRLFVTLEAFESKAIVDVLKSAADGLRAALIDVGVKEFPILLGLKLRYQTRSPR